MPSMFHLQQQFKASERGPPQRSRTSLDIGDPIQHVKGLLQFQIEFILRNSDADEDSDGWMKVSELIESKRIKAISKDPEMTMEAITTSPLFEHAPDLGMVRLRRIGAVQNVHSTSDANELCESSPSERFQQGYIARLSYDDMQLLNLKALTNKVKRVRPFLVPKVMPFELIFFRKVFSLLCDAQSVKTDLDEMPIQAFQRAFERFFRLLGDPRGFDSREYDQDCNGYVGWGEFFYVFQNGAFEIQLNILERVFLTLDDPEMSKLGTLFSFFILIMIAISSMGFILSTVPELQIAPGVPLPIFDTLEVAMLSIFCSEYLLRLLTVWTVRHELFDRPKLMRMLVENDPIHLSTPLSRIFRFWMQPSNLIDLAAILPPFIGVILPQADSGSFVVLRLIRLTRIFRAFRNPKLAEPVIIIGRTLQQSTKALYVLAFNLMLGILISSSLMWWAEKGTWDDNLHQYMRRVSSRWNRTTDELEDVFEESPFTSIPKSMWWAIVTSCTVGYGDQVPVTALGYTVAGVTMLFSLVILALPVGVIGGNFTSVWERFIAEKRREALQHEKDVDSLTNAIQFIAPATMRKVVIVEVWNDRLPTTAKTESEGDVQYDVHVRNPEGVLGRPDPAEFMGEAKLELEFLPTERLHITKTVKLEANSTLSKRVIGGSITLKLEWTPKKGSLKRHLLSSTRSTSNPALGTLAPGAFTELLGNLRVTILHGEKLINLNWKSPKSMSNPYCTFTCYPEAPAMGQEIIPHVWRTPTAINSLNPKWHAAHFDFHFKWTQEKYLNQTESNESGNSEPSKAVQRRKASKRIFGSVREALIRQKSRISLDSSWTREELCEEAPPTPHGEAPMLETYSLRSAARFDFPREPEEDEFFKTAREMEAGTKTPTSTRSGRQWGHSSSNLPGIPDSDR